MTAKIGGVAYIFEPDDNHYTRFWVSVLTRLIREGEIEIEVFYDWLDLLIEKAGKKRKHRF